mgnify:CR=1 FL=1|tara:strand:- start:19531 stop:19923 length:393 start_codon:yes stop_codon:yes gene_type:complete
MSDRILGKILEELQEIGDLQKELFKIKRMFDWPTDKDGFVEHMQEWKDAQPITDKSILSRLDDLWSLADDVNVAARDLEDECQRAESAIQDCSYYTPSDSAEELQQQITMLTKEIKNSKEQADADVEDTE